MLDSQCHKRENYILDFSILIQLHVNTVSLTVKLVLIKYCITCEKN